MLYFFTFQQQEVRNPDLSAYEESEEDEGKARSADEQTFYHDLQRPSYILLPIISEE
jgi:hypothetical protein